MRRPLILFLGIGYIVSCHKTETSPNKGWTWFGTSNPVVYSYVLINANEVTNKLDTGEFHIGIAAAFIDSNNNRLTGIDNLLVNNKPISMNFDSTYSFDYGKQASLNEGLALFGTNVQITIKGKSDADTATKTVYLPKRLVKVITDFPDAVNISQNLRLTWATDPNNPWGNVIIQISYYGALSQQNDPSFPKELKTLNYTVPDNGEFIINANDLHVFPPKSFIGVSIARGTQNDVVLPISKKRVFYFSNSSASTPPLLVTNQ